MKPKGVKIITEESEKEVTFLMDVDPLFVSLVKHAANQQPFRVIKEETEKGGEGSGHPRHDGRIGEKGGSQPYEGSNDWMKHGGSLGSKDRIINIGAVPKGGEGMSMIIQSILLPRGVSLDSLVTQKGLEFLSDADPDHKKEFDRYVRFEQLPVEKFDKDSLTLTKIHESGAWIIGGKLVDGTVAEKALTIAVVQKQPMADNPMNAPVRTIPMEPIEVSFGDVFQQELQAFLSVVTGVMSQSGRGTGDRKSDVLRALDAFGSFLSMSLDSIGEKAVKMNLPSDKREEKSERGGKEEIGGRGKVCHKGSASSPGPSARDSQAHGEHCGNREVGKGACGKD